MEYDRYLACVIQNEVHTISKRSEIKKNLDRCLKLIDSATKFGGTLPGSFIPLKLLAFGECFLQGFPDFNLSKIVKECAVEIPGEETDILEEKANEHDIYIAGSLLEVDPEWPDRFFNTGLVISPDRGVILKYRKYTPAMGQELTISPHDMYDEYIRKYGDDLKAFFPVVDTPIGKLGVYICMDGHFPESARALAIQGAEVLIRIGGGTSYTSVPPLEQWEIENRSQAIANVAYVVASNTGGGAPGSSAVPRIVDIGNSMIINYEGIVLCRINYHGESMARATIDLEGLRSYRMQLDHSYLALLRTEVFRKIYKRTVFPPNKALGKLEDDPMKFRREKFKWVPVNEFIQKSIFKSPRNIRSK
ncbi:MAG: nitrilase-related carbon-nitrogen hydrolase [Candidatus Baldrarchaeia archaeon]